MAYVLYGTSNENDIPLVFAMNSRVGRKYKRKFIL